MIAPGEDRAAGEEGKGWCELHCHSGFSLLDGASTPGALAARAAALGYPALALTDHDSLAGIVAHATACREAGIRAIAGCELTLEDGVHLTLLARDARGYRSLSSLLSAAHLAGSKGAPRATLADVAARAAGVECLTGCGRGAVPAALGRGDDAGARAALDALQSIFGASHLWVEVQRPGLPGDARLSHALAELARRRGLPLVATGNTHHADRADRDLQDVLVCIRERVPLARARPHLRRGASWHLRSPAAMARRFADLPGALDGARALAERCGFELAHIDPAFPAFPVPDGRTADGHLRQLVLAGAAERYGDAATSLAVQERLAHELATIAHLGMADYLLVAWDLVREARARGILCQGRGSAVGSLACYCLGITAVEPLAHRLSFERFLSAGRTDPPDVDLDLPADRHPEGTRHNPAREAIIQYALTRYAGHAALVCNVVTFRARSALREVGMAFGLDAAGMARLAPGIEAALAVAAPRPKQGQEIETRGGHPAAGSSLPARIADLCRRLEGLPRHLSQHPGGVVLSRRPLCEVAPLEHARMAGRTVIQWDKDGIEAAGLPKIDLLGLGMLGAIDRAFALVALQAGARPALHGFRCDDPAVYDLLCRMDTVGVFQVESRAQIAACLPHLQPRCYEDLIVAVALIRPGPIQGGAVHPYLRRRRGEEPVRYPGGEVGTRLLAPILGETLGVCLYQDQVIEIARAAGLDPAEAAALRRAMSGARDQGRMAALGGRLRAGLAAHGLDGAGQDEVATMVQAFSGYGFVKGHAAAFAYLAYVSSWLKVYHPVAFYGALLDLQPMGFYPPEVLVQDAARRGVRVLPVDARASGVDCRPEGDALRLGLRLIRGLGAEAAGRVAAAMGTDEPPATVEALCRRAGLDEGQARALARAGALRGLRDPRRRALWEAPVAARAGREGWLPDLAAAAEAPAALPPATESDELALDRVAVGFTPGTHTLAPLRRLLPAGLVRSADLAALPAGTMVEVAGQAISWQRPPMARGMLFLSLTDEDGLLNVVVPPRVRERDGEAALREPLVLVRGVLERRGRSLGIRATALRPLTAILNAGCGQ